MRQSALHEICQLEVQADFTWVQWLESVSVLDLFAVHAENRTCVVDARRGVCGTAVSGSIAVVEAVWQDKLLLRVRRPRRR